MRRDDYEKRLIDGEIGAFFEFQAHHPLTPRCLSMCRGSTDAGLSWNQPRHHSAEQVLVRVGAGEQEADTPGITYDDRPVLEQLEP